MFFDSNNIMPTETSIMNELKNPNELMEMYITDYVMRLDQEKINEFCAPGGPGEQLVEAGTFRKNTLVRLSKNDDVSRRTTMAAFNLAKSNNDPLWAALAKNRVKERELINNILKKYGNRAEKLAIVGQKEFIKQKLPASFMQSGGTTRL